MPSEPVAAGPAPVVPRSYRGRVDVLLFDLDGTLSDSAPGIVAALQYAFAVTGLPPLDPIFARTLVGPTFTESLPPLIGRTPLADVVEAYRVDYRAGRMFDAVVYPGVLDLLTASRSAGLRLAVATSKPEHLAVPVLQHLGLAGLFETIGGDDPAGGRPTKAAVIGEVLLRLGRPPVERVVMVGDRAHDVLGARAHGIACIGAGWGYGGDGELQRAGADPVCADAEQVAAALGVDRPGHRLRDRTGRPSGPVE